MGEYLNIVFMKEPRYMKTDQLEFAHKHILRIGIGSLVLAGTSPYAILIGQQTRNIDLSTTGLYISLMSGVITGVSIARNRKIQEVLDQRKRK